MRLSELGGLSNIGFLAGRAGDTATDPEEAAATAVKVATSRATSSVTAQENAAAAAANAEVARLEALAQNAEAIARKSPTAQNKAKAAAARAAANAAAAAAASRASGRAGRIKAAVAQATAAVQQSAGARMLATRQAAARSARTGFSVPGIKTSGGLTVPGAGGGVSLPGGSRTGPALPGQPAVSPTRTTVTQEGDPTGGKFSSRDRSGGPTLTREAPPVVNVLTCPTGFVANAAGTACVEKRAGTPVPDTGGGTITETRSEPPAPEPKSIQVTTPDNTTGGGGGGGGGQQYAPPSDFVMPTEAEPPLDLTKSTGLPPGTKPSTGSRTALYVGGALGAIGLGYLALKKFKKV